MVKKENNKITLTKFFNSGKELAIHCNNEKQAKALLNEFDKMGKRWISGDSYNDLSYFKEYGDKTTYGNDGYYCSVEYYLSEDIKVYEFEDVIFNKNYPNEIELTDDEKVILRNLDPKYNWIVRAESIGLFENKPYKDKTFGWTTNYGGFEYIRAFNHLFKCIKADEPCEFKKLL